MLTGQTKKDVAYITLVGQDGGFCVKGIHPWITTELKLFPIGTRMEYNGHRYIYRKGKDATK